MKQSILYKYQIVGVWHSNRYPDLLSIWLMLVFSNMTLSIKLILIIINIQLWYRLTDFLFAWVDRNHLSNQAHLLYLRSDPHCQSFESLYLFPKCLISWEFCLFNWIMINFWWPIGLTYHFSTFLFTYF